MKTTSKKFRRDLMLALCCALSVMANAQEVTANELSSIKPGAKINLVMDYSKAIIMGMNETDFSNYETDWNKDKPSIVSKFQKGANSKLGGVLNLGTFPDSPYTLVVKVKTISDVGNILCDAVMTNKEGTVLFSVKNVTGSVEPPFLPGTKLAKIKIWAALIGRSLGGILKSEYLDQ